MDGTFVSCGNALEFVAEGALGALLGMFPRGLSSSAAHGRRRPGSLLTCARLYWRHLRTPLLRMVLGEDIAQTERFHYADP